MCFRLYSLLRFLSQYLVWVSLSCQLEDGVCVCACEAKSLALAIAMLIRMLQLQGTSHVEILCGIFKIF